MSAYEWNPSKLDMVPEHLRDGLTRYVEQGIRPGNGLLSILMDRRLSEVLSACDDVTVANLRSIYRFLYNYATGQCHGDAQRVYAWIERGGIQGRAE